jgi:hypothetical protein
MIDCRDDESRIRKRSCRVMVPAEPSDITVGDDDQRQLCPSDGAILHTDETIIDTYPQVAKLHISRFGLAWIPDRAGQVRAMVEKLDARGVGGISHARKNNN